MALNSKSLKLIKEFEGRRLAAYLDPVGVWTIGYGHTSAAGAPVVVPGLTITDLEAEEILRQDLAQYEAAVDKAVKVRITENQRGALVSLCYNIGPAAFRKSTALRRLNAGDYGGAAEAMTWWNKADGTVLRGLVRRREAERALFLSDVGQPRGADVAAVGAVEGGEQKPMARSRTGWLGGVTLAGALATIREIRDTVPEVSEYLPYVLAVTGCAIIVNRWLEARRGEH